MTQDRETADTRTVSDTPRTDAVMDTLSLPLSWDALTLAEHARQLERSLGKAKRQLCRHEFKPHRMLTNDAGDAVILRTELCGKCGEERELSALRAQPSCLEALAELVRLQRVYWPIRNAHMTWEPAWEAARKALSAPQSDGSNARRLSEGDVEWVVNDNAELGVKIGEQFFWLYKGQSLIYEDGTHDDGTPMLWRPVGKREFGECCHPVKCIVENYIPPRYTEELVYIPGLSDGSPDDPKWKWQPLCALTAPPEK